MIERLSWRVTAVAFALCVVSHAPCERQDWSERRERILAAMQQVMGPLPSSPATKPEVVILEQTTFPKFVRRKIAFESGDGDSVPAYLFLPVAVPGGRDGRSPAVLCLHQTVKIGKGEPAGLGGKENLHYAVELAEHGFVALAPDYPGFGEYQIDAYAWVTPARP